MSSSGNYILPESYNGEVPSKPPLLHWAINGFSIVTGGINEFSARAPSALCALLFAMLLLSLIRSYYDGEAALLSVIILSTSFEWYRAATTARVDMIFSAALAAALIFWFRWFTEKDKHQIIFCILTLTAATLSKGPVALILFSGVTSLYLLYLTRSIFMVLLTVMPIAVVCLFLSSSWYLAAWMTEEQKFFSKFYYENVARFTSTMDDEPHRHNILYLYGMLLVGLLPWSILALFASKDSYRISMKSDRLLQFCLIAIATTAIFFSIPSSKRGVYLLPAYPFLSIIAARFLAKRDLLLKAGFVVVILYLIGDGIIAPRIANSLSYKSFADETKDIVAQERVLYSFDDEFYGISFYLKKPFRSVLKAEDLDAGYVYLYEDNAELFKKAIPGRSITQVARSSSEIVKKGKHVILVKVGK